MENDNDRNADPGEVAVRWFRSGFSCAESVVLALSPWYPEELRDPQRLAAAFGGGIARRGLTCGCITGAALALGAAMGRTSAADTETRDRVYAATNRILAAFEGRFVSLDCRQLTGLDFTVPMARAEWDAGVREELCVHLVRATAKLAAEELRRAGVAAQAQAKAAMDRTP